MTTTTADLAAPAMRVLLDTAPAIVDRLRVMFAARALAATPASLAARLDVDSTYSTPELALLVEAQDPTGFYDYGVTVAVTGASDGDHLIVDDYRRQYATDNADPEAVAAFVFGILLDRLPELTDDELARRAAAQGGQS